MIDALQDLQTELDVARDNEAYLLEKQAAINAAHQREIKALQAALKEAVDALRPFEVEWQEHQFVEPMPWVDYLHRYSDFYLSKLFRRAAAIVAKYDAD